MANKTGWMRPVLSYLCMAALLAAAGCGDNRSKEKAARAAADMFVLDETAFNDYLHTLGRDHENGDIRAKLKEEWQRQTLFARAAMTNELDRDPSYQAALLQFKRDALAQRYVDVMLRERATNVVLKPQYAAKKDELAVPEMHLAAIFISEPPGGGAVSAEAASILQQLSAGADFSEIAKEVSADGATAARGGDMGWLPLDVAVQRFGEVVREAAPDSVVGPITAPHGVYLVKVLEPKRTRVPEFADVRRQLLEQQRAAITADLEKELRSQMGTDR